MNTGRNKTRPNIVLILIDTLRADRLSCYGYGRQTTPFMDRIAEQGVLYERAISAAAWTPPSHASIFTGVYPSRHGVELSHLVLGPDLSPLPEMLRRHGYRTFCVSSNYWLSRETRFDRGFDRFVHSWQLVQTSGTNQALKRQQRKQAVGLEPAANGTSTKRRLLLEAGNSANWLFERATKKLRRSFNAYDDGAWRVNRHIARWASDWKRMEQPFFAFVHYMEPHIRYAAPGRYRTMHVPPGTDPTRINKVNQDPWRYLAGRADMGAEDLAILGGLYDGEVSYVDYRVGQLYTLLSDEGLLRDTLFIITSDHGENLGDHNLMSHSYCLYDTLLHVPLIVHYPPEFPPGQRISTQVQTVDLFPTILDLADIRDVQAWDQAQGQSLIHTTGSSGSGRLVFSEYLEPEPSLSVLTGRYPGFDASPYDRALRSVRTASHKYISASDGRAELYDLARDPHEEGNLISIETETAHQLRTSLEEWSSSFEHASRAEPNIEIDSDMRKRLEDLGYLA